MIPFFLQGLAWTLVLAAAMPCLKAQSIPPSRLVPWASAGLSETPPALRRSIPAADFGVIGDGIADDGPALQSALLALDSLPGMVLLEPGIYVIRQTIDLPPGAVLRGAGADSTILIFDFGGANQDAIRIGNIYVEADIPLPRAPKKGDRILHLNPGMSSSFSPGDWIEVVQDNGDWDQAPAAWAAESVGHISKVEHAMGDSLFLEEAVRLSMDSMSNPRLRKIAPTRFCGVECLKIQRSDSGAGGSAVYFYLAADSWVRGVESFRSAGSHVMAVRSAHLEVSGSYFHEAWAYDGVSTHGYGVTLARHSVACLIQDNVFQKLRHAMMVKQGANGNVFAYNYSREPHRSEIVPDFSGDISLHGHYPFANLFEGNTVQNIFTDNYWGPSGPGNTFFRNRTELYGIVMTSEPTSFQNYIGNDMQGTAPLYGNFILTGTDHFSYGNLVRGVLEPPGTDGTVENSLFLHSSPTWWDGPDPWPVSGFGSSGILPAQSRYLAGSPVVCRSAECRAPDQLVALNLSSSAALFTWREVPGAQAYQWKGRMESGSTFRYRYVSAPALSLGGLIEGLTYEWQVRGRCEDRISPSSKWASYTVPVLRGPEDFLNAGQIFYDLSPGLKSNDPQSVSDPSQLIGPLVFPNPATEYLFIRAQGNWQLFDLLGVERYSGSGPGEIAITYLPKGIYWFHANGQQVSVVLE
jgi:hypothetical protein